jgi:hypothetical protein
LVGFVEAAEGKKHYSKSTHLVSFRKVSLGDIVDVPGLLLDNALGNDFKHWDNPRPDSSPNFFKVS